MKKGEIAMTIAIPSKVTALVHRRHHPKRVRTDWDIHGHPHHYVFIETSLMAREMDHL
jgi:hypothetical protein